MIKKPNCAGDDMERKITYKLSGQRTADSLTASGRLLCASMKLPDAPQHQKAFMVIKMEIEELTIGQAKELVQIFNTPKENNNSLNCMIGKKVIVRTYSAGVWFGELEQKAGNEVILKNARRMWRWWALKSISLYGVAKYGIKQDKSKIAPTVENVWLEAIEIIPCTVAAIESIDDAEDVKAE